MEFNENKPLHLINSNITADAETNLLVTAQLVNEDNAAIPVEIYLEDILSINKLLVHTIQINAFSDKENHPQFENFVVPVESAQTDTKPVEPLINIEDVHAQIKTEIAPIPAIVVEEPITDEPAESQAVQPINNQVTEAVESASEPFSENTVESQPAGILLENISLTDGEAKQINQSNTDKLDQAVKRQLAAKA